MVATRNSPYGIGSRQPGESIQNTGTLVLRSKASPANASTPNLAPSPRKRGRDGEEASPPVSPLPAGKRQMTKPEDGGGRGNNGDGVGSSGGVNGIQSPDTTPSLPGRLIIAEGPKRSETADELVTDPSGNPPQGLILTGDGLQEMAVARDGEPKTARPTEGRTELVSQDPDTIVIRTPVSQGPDSSAVDCVPIADKGSATRRHIHSEVKSAGITAADMPLHNHDHSQRHGNDLQECINVETPHGVIDHGESKDHAKILTMNIPLPVEDPKRRTTEIKARNKSSTPANIRGLTGVNAPPKDLDVIASVRPNELPDPPLTHQDSPMAHREPRGISNPAQGRRLFIAAPEPPKSAVKGRDRHRSSSSNQPGRGGNSPSNLPPKSNPRSLQVKVQMLSHRHVQTTWGGRTPRFVRK